MRKDFQSILDTSTKVKKSIERVIEFYPKKGKPIVAFSGGKDSLIVYLMAAKSGKEFTPIYSPTSVDPPELINFIRNIFNSWAKEKGWPEVIFNKYNKFTEKRAKGKATGKEITMWTLISNRAMPPTRLMRYCCDELKERTGKPGDTIITGVRWEESNKRKKQSMVGFYKKKIMLRPIIDWTDAEVWSYILENNIPYCELYDKGWDRLGCIGCPLGSNQKRELEAYPRFKQMYINSFDRMIQYRKDNNMDVEWSNGEEVLKWWVGDTAVKTKVEDGQCSMF